MAETTETEALLERLRVELALTWGGLAEHLGVTTMQLWRWRKGLVTPETLTQARMAETLGVERGAVLDRPWPEWLRDREPAS